MSRTRLSALALILGTGTIAVAAASFASLAQDPPMPQPTKEHEMLLATVGEYEGTLTMNMGGRTMEMKAQETLTALGSFWILGKFECEFQGMSYVSSSNLGYDTAKKKFVGTYIDNMSTEIAASEGAMSADGKTLVMTWEGPDEMTGKRVKQRSETTYTAEGYTANFYKGEGSTEKSMTMTMKRKAPGEAKGAAK